MRDLAFLLRVAGVRRRDLAAAVLAGSVTLLSALSLTVLSGWLITRAWQMPPVLHLSVAITAVRALGISRAVFRYVDRLVSHRLGLSALTTLRARVYDAMAASAPVTRARGHASLVGDTERVTDYIVRSVVPRGVAAVLSLACVIFAAWLHPAAAAVLAAAFAVTGLAVPRLALRGQVRYRETADEYLARLDDVLGHRAEFLAAGLAEQRLDAAVAASGRDTRAVVDAQRPLATADAVQAWATGAVTLAITLIGVTAYPGSPVWLGMLVMLPLAAFESHAALPDAAVHARDAAESAARLRRILTHPTPPPPAAADTGGVVEARGLRTTHGDAVWDFRLEPGERLLVQGPSGCGKTTMLETLAGLRAPAAGEALAPAGTRLFAEDAWVFATTVRDNLLVAAPSLDDATATAVLAAVGFEFPLDFLLANGADSLSSGQRRRLLLARALCSEADVLLLDEPTAHLSPDAAESLLDTLLRGPLPGPKPLRTVIVVAHDEG